MNKIKVSSFEYRYHQRVSMAVGMFLLLIPISIFAGSGDVTVSGTVTAERFVTEKEPLNIGYDLEFSTDVAYRYYPVYRVPLGQRYVIESISVYSTTSACGFYLLPSVTVEAGGENLSFKLPKPERTYFTEFGTYRNGGTWPIKLYAESDSRVVVSATRTLTDCPTTVTFSFAGYLESE